MSDCKLFLDFWVLCNEICEFDTFIRANFGIQVWLDHITCARPPWHCIFIPILDLIRIVPLNSAKVDCDLLKFKENLLALCGFKLGYLLLVGILKLVQSYFGSLQVRVEASGVLESVVLVVQVYHFFCGSVVLVVQVYHFFCGSVVLVVQVYHLFCGKVIRFIDTCFHRNCAKTSLCKCFLKLRDLASKRRHLQELIYCRPCCGVKLSAKIDSVLQLSAVLVWDWYDVSFIDLLRQCKLVRCSERGSFQTQLWQDDAKGPDVTLQGVGLTSD